MRDDHYRGHLQPHHRGHYIARIILFCTLAVGVTALVFVWGLGYRVNPQSGEIRRVGTMDILPVQSIPGLEVTLGDAYTTDSLPRKGISLRPGVYQVVVRAPGYQPWRSQVTIRASEYYRLEDILLVPEEPQFEETSCPTSTQETNLRVRDGEVRSDAGDLLWRQGASFVDSAWFARDTIAVLVDTSGTILILGTINKVGQTVQSPITNPRAVHVTGTSIVVCGDTKSVLLDIQGARTMPTKLLSR